MKIKILFLLLFLVSALNAQRLLKMSVAINGETERISYLSRRGTEFVSAKELSKVLNANHYYNQETSKLELKFDKYKIKFTGRNQFVIVINRSDNSYQVFQIPISTLLVRGDVLIPIKYCIDYINLAYGKKLVYHPNERHIEVTDSEFDTFAFLKEENKIETPKSKNVKNAKFDIYGISIDEKSNGTFVRINTKSEIRRFSSSIQNDILYLFLPEISVDLEMLTQIKSTGLVKNVTHKNIRGSIQLEFNLKNGYSKSEAYIDDETKDIFITIHNKLLSREEPDLNKSIKKWEFNTVIIDAGHGGKDGGAIGVKGVKEKDVNLGVALKLGKLIEQRLKGVNVVYTRKDDTFIELYKRGKIANENNGNLFISIHANSAGRKARNARGFEVYLLRPGKTDKAIEIAEFENSVIQYEENPDKYKKLNDENFILVSMAHSSYMRYSEHFSDILNNKWEKNTSIPSRGIKQAGFYVLVGASMPGVLIETGFLSNKKDEQYLKSKKGQNEIAFAIFSALKEYKEYYDKTLKEELE